VAWGSGDDLLKAYEALKKLAREANYQDVVGVRFVVEQDVYARTIIGAGITTTFTWLAYGTCIRY
jgi:hypothetical protein